VLGEGEELLTLKNLARQLRIDLDISFQGFVDNPFAYMARASLFVLSSAWEGLSNVLLEALACGCPVVSTDCASGPREILENGRYGTLVPVGDDAALAHAILGTLDQPRQSDRLRARASMFSVAAAIDRYLRVIEDAIARHGGALPAAQPLTPSKRNRGSSSPALRPPTSHGGRP
jgi:glycosyltransferase involved in cell wall biosynthesis